MNFKPFPTLHTSRLLLRKFEDSDADVILFLRSDKTVTKYIERPESEQDKTLDDALKFIKKIKDGIASNSFISWGICMPDDPKMIGSICLWNFSGDGKTAELGYDLHPQFQGKGIMSEALKSILNYGFMTLHLNMIEAFTHRDNEGSKHLLEKNGFSFNESRKDEENQSNSIFEIYKSI
jgi:ribosomal-protein-alanine N-acetyltransferase